MWLQSSVILLSALARTGLAALDLDVGLGIHLASGYATISARFGNGDFLDIAKMEGSARYKAYMLGAQEDLPASVVSPVYCPLSQQMCQSYWPLSGVVKSQNALAPIVQTLIGAAESTLEKSVQSVVVTVHDLSSFNHEAALHDIQSALGDIKVYSWDRLDDVSRLLVPAFNLQGNCSDPYTLPDDPGYYADPPKLILTVEYTRHSLIAVLWEEECSVASQRQGFVTSEFGHNAMDWCKATEKESGTCDKVFKATLGRVLDDGQGSKSGSSQAIDAVFLLGEQGFDDAFVKSVREVLSEHFTNGGTVNLFAVKDASLDPTYVGSRVAAVTEWEAKGPYVRPSAQGEL